MQPPNEYPPPPHIPLASVSGAADGTETVLPGEAKHAPTSAPQPSAVNTTTGQKVGAPGGMLTLVAFFLAWVTVSQTSCGSVLTKGTWSGWDLLLSQGWSGNDPLGVFLVPLVIAGVFGAYVGLRYWRDIPPWPMLVANFIASLCGVEYILFLTFWFIGNPGQPQPGLFLEVAALALTLTGAALLLWTHAPPPRHPGSTSTGLGLTSMLASFIPLLFFLCLFYWSIVVDLEVSPLVRTFNTVAVMLFTLSLPALIIALVTGHILMYRARMQAVHSADLLYARVGLLISYSTLIAVAYFFLAGFSASFASQHFGYG
jgi:hypothetical protein